MSQMPLGGIALFHALRTLAIKNTSLSNGSTRI